MPAVDRQRRLAVRVNTSARLWGPCAELHLRAESAYYTSLITPIGWFTAFSGDGVNRNNPTGENVANGGPIPPGMYYIVDRESGGLLGPARDWALGRDEWFALYRNDGAIDDATFIGGVRRGQFRLHPLGPRRMSTGCIVLNDHEQFARLRKYLLSVPPGTVPGRGMRTYGTIDVGILAPDSKPAPRGPRGTTGVA